MLKQVQHDGISENPHRHPELVSGSPHLIFAD